MAKLLKEPIEIYRDDYIKVLCVDEQGAGGAHHYYDIYKLGDEPREDRPIRVIRFQEGPILEEGVNGETNEALLAIVLHRLTSFQAGPFPSELNEIARHNVQSALSALETRTRDRKARNVEGKSEA